MKKRDHYTLACRLVDTAGDLIPEDCVLPFIFGCVEPDLNWFTYLRGMLRGKKFHGHNAANCAHHIQKRIFSLQRRGLNSAVDYFQLGVLLHYLADTFTSVHNSFLDVPVKEHLEYEARLHDMLERKLEEGIIKAPSTIPYSIISHLLENYETFRDGDHTPARDVEYITRMCTSLLYSALALSYSDVRFLGATSF